MGCTGKGDANGGHCCWVNGQLCEFVTFENDLPRCTLWAINMRKSSRWRNAPIGQAFARNLPGYTCKDWPQNIPEVMAAGVGLCCYRSQ